MRNLPGYFVLVFALLASCSPETIIMEEGSEIIIEEGNIPADLTTEERLLGWVASMQADNGLVESAEGTQFVSLYDNALAALLFMESDSEERARKVLDHFHSMRAQEFEATGGGFFQFRNTQGTGKSRVWLGDNLWLLIAMNHYQNLYSSSRYNTSIEQLTTWVKSLQDTDGGLWGGYEEDGRRIPKVTEGILTAYFAIPGFGTFHEKLAAYLMANRWNDMDSILMAEDQAGPYAHALDLHSLPALIWPDGGSHFLESANRFYTVQQHSIHNLPIGGYCFDEDQDVVWLEGSAQMALALRVNGAFTEYQKIREDLELSLLQSDINPQLLGMPYAANQGSSFGAVPLWEHADQTPAISATVWFYFATTGFNPLNITVAGKPGLPFP